jgi:hypothetical protein
MPRLIDDLRAQAKLQKPWFVPPHRVEAWKKLALKLGEMICDPELPVILMDNVADYYYTGSDQEHWDLQDDFPNVAPPFDQFWIEHRMPRMIHSREKGDTDVTALIQHGRVGTLVTALDPANVTADNPLPREAKWILWCEIFIDYGLGGLPQGPHGSMFVAVTADGAVMERPWMQSFATEDFHDHMRAIMAWLHPVFLAISFLHCKNVQLVDNRVDAPLAKKYRLKHGINPTAYKTLVIEPLKQVLRTEGRSGEVGLQKAMHICRGHFRDYREGRGLFGKYHQLVWTPMTVRGTRGKKTPPRRIEVKI